MAKLTLDNFEQHTPSIILERGRTYFDKGYIVEQEEWDGRKYLTWCKDLKTTTP